jgi:glycosyltransferase involved in cell wall biosynthesis
MKTISHFVTPAVKDGAIARSPVRVCMHVLGQARTDGRVMREATSLRDAGFEVSIVDTESESALPNVEDINDICVKHIIMPSWFIPTRFKLWFIVKAAQVFILGTLKLISSSADIYHAHDENALPACYIAARLRHKPLIYDAHELPLSDPSVTRWHRLHALSAHLLECMVQRCASIITVSSPIAKIIHQRYHSPEVVLIRNVPMYQNVRKNERLRRYLDLSPHIRIALYQGNLQADRGLDQLIYAATFLERDIVIVMMGKDKVGTQAQLEALIAREGVADRVKIIPPVPYEELLEWTASADTGLIVYSSDYSPNNKMCLPNKLFEYLMAGLPVLASSLDAVADILETYDVGRIVPSLTPKDIGAAINSMLADPATLTRMYRNALEAAQRDFCWETERQQLIGLYHDILRKKEERVSVPEEELVP